MLRTLVDKIPAKMTETYKLQDRFTFAQSGSVGFDACWQPPVSPAPPRARVVYGIEQLYVGQLSYLASSRMQVETKDQADATPRVCGELKLSRSIRFAARTRTQARLVMNWTKGSLSHPGGMSFAFGGTWLQACPSETKRATTWCTAQCLHAVLPDEPKALLLRKGTASAVPISFLFEERL